MIVVIDIPQPVFDNAVLHFGVTQLGAVTVFGQVIRHIAHTLHSAGNNDIGLFQLDLVGCDHDRFHAGGTYLVDRGARGKFREPRLDGCLPGRCLADTGRQDVAEYHFIDIIRFDSGRLDDLHNGHGAEFGGSERGETASE